MTPDADRVAHDQHGTVMVESAPKTSTAAVFSLVFGLSALFSALLGLLAPLAVVFSIIGLILGFIGLGKAKLPGVTGRGVAIGGIVLSVLGLLIGVALLIGATILVDNIGADGLESRLQDLRDAIPTELPSE